MAFWVYILKCSDGRFYAGHTDDLERRIGQHQNGLGGDFIARRRPVRLVWSETFPTREEALTAERQIKPWSRAKKEALIAGDFARLSYYARPPAERPSTSLGTNGNVAEAAPASHPRLSPFVPSEVEGFVPSEVEGFVPSEVEGFVPSEVEGRQPQGEP